MTKAKIHISFVMSGNIVDAVFECDDYAIGEDVFTAVMSKRKDGEPVHLKIFPLCNVLELDIKDTE